MADEAISKSIAPNAWSRFSITLAQPNIGCPPETYLIGYISKGEAFIATGSVETYYVLGEVTRIGVGKDIAVCYDGRWRKNADQTFSYYTLDEPFIAVVETDNRLYVRQGLKGGKKLMATGVTRCCLVRGWKHISKPQDDQGMCLFYLKSGRLYSREYVQKEDGAYIWTNESQYKTIHTGITNISASRTLDYRILVSIVTPRGNFGLLTARTWAGGAIPDETVGAYAEVQAEIKPQYITTITNKVEADNITSSAAITSTVLAHSTAQPKILSVTNTPTGTQIEMRLSVLPEITSLEANPEAIEFRDADNKLYATYSATIVDSMLVFTIKNMSNSVGDISFVYTSGWKTSDPTIAFKAFSGSFTPKGLTPIEPDPPILVSIQNVDSEVYNGESN